MKIAIVHDWLVTYAGAERVLEQMLHCYPKADLYSVVDFLPESQRYFLRGKKPKTTFLQKFPFARQKYRQMLPLMPRAIEALDLSGYDLILSSSHAVAKGIRTNPEQIHVSYIHSPMRYAWNMQEQYLRETGLDSGLRGRVVRDLLARIRKWDFKTAQSIDYLLANSKYIARRIQNCYGRESTVIYPPVDTKAFREGGARQDYYVTVSRLVPYKKVDLIVAAFAAMPDKQLIVIGDGPERKKIKDLVRSNIHLLGALSFDAMKKYLSEARAYVFAAEEDFGISPVEAQACGVAVIAFGKGGTCETVLGLSSPEPSGVFFGEQSVESLKKGVELFEANQALISPANCRRSAERFSIERFRDEYMAFVSNAIATGAIPRGSLKSPSPGILL